MALGPGPGYGQSGYISHDHSDSGGESGDDEDVLDITAPDLDRAPAEGRDPPPAAALGGRAGAGGRAAGGGGRLEMDIEISDDSDDEMGGSTRQGSVHALGLDER